MGALSVIGMLRRVLWMRADPKRMEGLRREFAIVFTRWVIVLILIYAGAFWLGEWGVVLVVIGYAAASIASEINPDRFANLFGRGNPPANSAAPTRSPGRRKKRK